MGLGDRLDPPSRPYAFLCCLAAARRTPSMGLVWRVHPGPYGMGRGRVPRPRRYRVVRCPPQCSPMVLVRHGPCRWGRLCVGTHPPQPRVVRRGPTEATPRRPMVAHGPCGPCRSIRFRLALARDSRVSRPPFVPRPRRTTCSERSVGGRRYLWLGVGRVPPLSPPPPPSRRCCPTTVHDGGAQHLAGSHVWAKGHRSPFIHPTPPSPKKRHVWWGYRTYCALVRARAIDAASVTASNDHGPTVSNVAVRYASARSTAPASQAAWTPSTYAAYTAAVSGWVCWNRRAAVLTTLDGPP